jgi:superfamily I DNA/RNA helicase
MSEDKRKKAHVTGFFGLNRDNHDKGMGWLRINSLLAREDDSDDNAEVAEERRLAFVAVTRAKSLLFLMHRQQVVRFQDDGGSKSALRIQSCKPSRFLSKLSALGKESVVSLKWKSS